MMITQVLQLKDGMTLKHVATEITALNQFVGKLGMNPAYQKDWDALPDPKPATHPPEWDWFPRPFKCDPDSTIPQGFVGDSNTPPDAQGYFTVIISNFTYINWGKLPAAPQTFNIVSGKPEETGVFA